MTATRGAKARVGAQVVIIVNKFICDALRKKQVFEVIKFGGLDDSIFSMGSPN